MIEIVVGVQDSRRRFSQHFHDEVHVCQGAMWIMVKMLAGAETSNEDAGPPTRTTDWSNVGVETAGNARLFLSDCGNIMLLLVFGLRYKELTTGIIIRYKSFSVLPCWLSAEHGNSYKVLAVTVILTTSTIF